MVDSLPDLQQSRISWKPGTVDKRITTHCRWVLNEFGTCRFLYLNGEDKKLGGHTVRRLFHARSIVERQAFVRSASYLRGKTPRTGRAARLGTSVDADGRGRFRFSRRPVFGRVLLTHVESPMQGVHPPIRRASAPCACWQSWARCSGHMPARFQVLEELEFGIRTNRLALLVQLLETSTAQGKTQVVATTHSPQLLRLLSRKSLDHASVVYRLPDTSAGRMKCIEDIPPASISVLATAGLPPELHDINGLFADVLNFSDGHGTLFRRSAGAGTCSCCRRIFVRTNTSSNLIICALLPQIVTAMPRYSFARIR